MLAQGHTAGKDVELMSNHGYWPYSLLPEKETPRGLTKIQDPQVRGPKSKRPQKLDW